jgi:DNA-binding NtrC family response regulator
MSTLRSHSSHAKTQQVDVLLVDDSITDLELTERALGHAGYHVEVCRDAPEALTKLEAWAPRVLMTDYRLQSGAPMDGLDLCRQAARDFPDIPTIVLTGHANMDLAIDALRAGAYDFVPKDRDYSRFREALNISVKRAMEHERLHQEVIALRLLLQNSGGDPKLRRHYPPLEEVERRYVFEVLASTGYNKAEAARILGLDRTTLYRKLQRYAGQVASREEESKISNPEPTIGKA